MESLLNEDESHLLQEGFKCIVTGLLHFMVDVTTELGHGIKHLPVVGYEAAAELGRVPGEQSKSSC